MQRYRVLQKYGIGKKRNEEERHCEREETGAFAATGDRHRCRDPDWILPADQII